MDEKERPRDREIAELAGAQHGVVARRQLFALGFTRGQIDRRLGIGRLHSRDRAALHGIPVTSVHRTLLDYAELAAPQQLGWAFEAADRLDLLNLNAIDELCARSAGRHGRKRLQALVTEHRGPAPETRSELERRFLALIRDAGLPEPSVNVVVA